MYAYKNICKPVRLGGPWPTRQLLIKFNENPSKTSQYNTLHRTVLTGGEAEQK